MHQSAKLLGHVWLEVMERKGIQNTLLPLFGWSINHSIPKPHSVNGAFGCSGGMRMRMVMVIRMKWNRNGDSIMLFGCTFGINS